MFLSNFSTAFTAKSESKKLIKSAKNNSATSVLLTFFPHPRMVLQKDLDIKLINTIEERTKLLESLGLETLVIHEFSKDFANLSALEFVKNILTRFYAK